MIHKHLMQLRKQHGMTLKDLSDKVGYGTGNLSSYEHGRLRAKDPTVLRILVRGYDLSKDEAKQTLALWRKEEVEQAYRIPLAQAGADYNSGAPKKTLEQFLKEEGLSARTIAQIKKLVQQDRRK